HLWSSRNPYSLSSARMMAWSWSVALLMSCVSIGTTVIDGDIVWWWIPWQAGLLVLDVVMARHSWTGLSEGPRSARHGPGIRGHHPENLETKARTHARSCGG